MATPEEQNESAAEAKGPLLQRLRAWATGSRKRSAIVMAGLLLVTGATFGVWLFLAQLAAPQQMTSLDSALKALDEGDLELAGALVGRMQEENSISTQEYGGPLFVLGAIRAQRAAEQWTPDRRRRDYLVAAKYLDEARSLGVPEDREYEALYLLGKAYIGSDQLAEGVNVLEKALKTNPTHETEIHGLLAKAHYHASYPDYPRALRHLDRVLADPALSDEVRGQTLLQKARALSRLSRHDDAMAVLSQLPAEVDPAEAKLVEGMLLVRAAAGQNPPPERLLTRAEQALAEAQRLDKLSTIVTSSGELLLGQISLLKGEDGLAMRRFIGIRKRFGMSSAGIAASVAEGELLRKAGDNQTALDAYRRALDSVAETSAYQSELLPLPELRSVILGAHGGLVSGGHFEEALELVDRMGPLFGETREMELRAETQERWGDELLGQAMAKSWPLPELQRRGRLRLREAGVTFHQLAQERFATAKYPDDLWRSAEAFYRGQSYTSATRVLRDYLKNEPVRRNALALLRIGQSQLALGHAQEAVEAFEECVEFHPFDAATYGARLAAAKAHRDMGEMEQAEELLRANLIGSTLTPRSPEWRDSKFELGSLLHEIGRHNDAIDHLEEAIMREETLPFPDAKQIRVARYLVAESYRHAAEVPMMKYFEAKAVNERELNERLFRELLTKALSHYDKVQREISGGQANTKIDQTMLRNCYMLKGSVLFDLGRYKEAVDEYSNVSALYQNEPFVLETLLQISNCWRRLGESEKARGNVEQALVALERMPVDADFASTTTRSRREWESLLREIRSW